MIKDKNISPGAFIQATKVAGMGIAGPITGEVFYVAASGGQPRSWLDGKVTTDHLHLTITAALAKCVAGRGDVIYVAPGYTTTVAAAGGITVNKAGVSIIGLGNGTLRPTLTWSAAASSILVTAANVTIKNFITTISIDEVVSMFAVSAAGCTLDGVDFIEYGALGVTGQAIQFLLTTAAATDLTIMNCRHTQQTAATADQVWIQLVGTSNTRIFNNSIKFLAKAATGSICISGSTAVINVEIVGNRIFWAGATITTIINLVTTSTGIITDNRLYGGSSVVVTAAITGDGCLMAENYFANTLASSGALTPAIDVITS